VITETEVQKNFWNRNALDFDSIYSGEKRWVNAALDGVFRKDMYERFRFTMESSVPVVGKDVLDVGCGTGHYSLALARQGARVVHGIDVSDAMVEISRRRAVKYGLHSTCVFSLGDPLELALEDKYDVTIGMGLFDYVKDPLPLMKWMKEQTAGRVILSFPRKYTWRAPVRKFRLRMKGCPVYFYSRKEVLALLSQANLDLRRLERVGKLYCVVADSS
jgi:2-polyprenyl-3-methyl-5-hydroxy-6-metoxy-1,4-benzoquinol methylase